MKRFTISGIEHFIRILTSKPELMSLASLAPLRVVAEKAKKASQSCGCNATKVYNESKGTFELALNNIQHGDHIIIKASLSVDQLCYYTRDNMGQLKLKCI